MCPRCTAGAGAGTGAAPSADPARPAGLLAAIGDGLSTRLGIDISVLYFPYGAAPLGYAAAKTTGVEGLRAELAAQFDSADTTSAAAQVVDILARVDVTRIATDIGIGQE